MKEQERYRSWVEVDLEGFAANWRELRRLVGPQVKVMQVVKADAYGHGAIEISNAALANGAACLGVANADEGVQLRISGITAPIVILSPATPSEIGEIIKYGITPSVSDLMFARELQRRSYQAGVRTAIHVEVDTGMGRGGTMLSEASSLIGEIARMPNLVLEGIFTHLAESEIISYYNDQQWREFIGLLAGLKKMGLSFPLRHISNSGAVLNYPSFNLDMVRPGIMTYGIYPSDETRKKASLTPVMSFKTRVVLVKEFPEGYTIGYGRSYLTRRPTRIATIPVGYGDGLGWLMGNKGEALIRGRRVPIVGRISMDMCTLDVSSIPECAVGDEVVLMGTQGREAITADEIAIKTHTISYDVLCSLGKRAPRIFVNKGKTQRIEPSLRRIFIPDEERSLARIDGLIRRCLQSRAQSEELGDAIFSEVFETLFGKEDRQLEIRTDFKYAIRLSPFGPEEDVSPEVRRDYLKVTTHVQYRKTIRHSLFLIGFARDRDQLATLFNDSKCEYRWLLNGAQGQADERAFRVIDVRLDDEPVPVVRTQQTERGYEVWCGAEGIKVNRQGRFQIEIESRLLKASRLFSAYLVYPTRGMEISFCYTGTGIKNVRDIGFFAGRQPNPEAIREEGKSITLRLGEEIWVFPTSGVTFVWDM